MVGRARRRLAQPVNRAAVRLLGTDDATLTSDNQRRRAGGVVFWTVVGAVIGYGAWRMLRYGTADDGWAVIWTPTSPKRATASKSRPCAVVLPYF
jgi:hypothetical protein